MTPRGTRLRKPGIDYVIDGMLRDRLSTTLLPAKGEVGRLTSVA